MLHYGIQHQAVHEQGGAGGGGGHESLSHVDAAGDGEYAQWLLSAPDAVLSPVHVTAAGSQQAFLQDAYTAQQTGYYPPPAQPPATPVPVDGGYDAQDQFEYYLYSPVDQQQQQQPQQPPQQEQQYAYYPDDQQPAQQAEPQEQHILATPPSSVYPQQDSYALYTSFSSPPEQQQQHLYSSSPIEHQPQQSPQPPLLSTPRARAYPPSTNPVRPSRLRQVSNYEDDVPDAPDVPDPAENTQSASFDERLAASVLVPQPSESLAFALASPVKISQPVATSSSLSHALDALTRSRADPETSVTDIPESFSSSQHSQSQSDSLYDALFGSADVAPIVTTREEVPVDSWAADADVLRSGAVDATVESSSLAGALSEDSALAGAVMDEFDVDQSDPANFGMDLDPALSNAAGPAHDVDADADGETEAGSPPLPVQDVSASSSSTASNALTASTLADDDWFTSPQAGDLKLGDAAMPVIKDEYAVQQTEVEFVLAEAAPRAEIMANVLSPMSSPSASEHAAAVAIGLSSLGDPAVAPALGTKDDIDPASALLALASPARPTTPLNTTPPSAPSSASVPLITAVAPKRATGAKRKRGSATSSPSRSRVASPMPVTPVHPRRRFFPSTPIAFHMGPLDESDPRQRMRHGTRTNKIIGIDAENQLEEKDRDHDLFVMRGGVFDHVPNGVRSKATTQRSAVKPTAKGAENLGLRSSTGSRAGSAAGSSPAPGGSKPNTRAKKAKVAAATRDSSEVVFTPPTMPDVMQAPPERPKREARRVAQSPTPLFTTTPRELPPYVPGQPLHSGTTYSIEPITVSTYPVRDHASLQSSFMESMPMSYPEALPMSFAPVPAPAPDPLPAPVPAPLPAQAHTKRAPPKRPAAPKGSKAKKRKRFEDDGFDDEDVVGKLENINHDGGYDDDYAASSSVRSSVVIPVLKRPRRNIPPPPEPAPPIQTHAVPPRSNAALPPIAPGLPPYPGTPSAESMRSLPSPLTPLTDLPSSSPPAPLGVASPSPMPMPPPVPTSRPQTPIPMMHVPVSPISTLTPSPRMTTPAPQPAVAKRGPRRAAALPVFSNVPLRPALESPVASTSAVVAAERVRTGEEVDFPVLHPLVNVTHPTYRTFPPGMELKVNEFPGWYRRYPLLGTFRPYDPMGDAVLGTQERPKGPAGGTFNNPTTAYDLYTPRYVKGTGREKHGMCPICAEAPERGGEGKQFWFAMKVSAYNYHMQNAHGISAGSKLPFSPPIEFRSVKREVSGRHEKDAVLEGKCHQCQKFIPLEGVKLGDIKVKEIYWWKHAAKCHQTSAEGESDLYYEDEVLALVKSYEDRERSTILRMTPRAPISAPSYPVSGSFVTVPSSLPPNYIHAAPSMQAVGYNVPTSIPPGHQMSYGQAAAASITQYQVQMPIAGPSHHGSPIDPSGPSFIRMHAASQPPPMSLAQYTPMDADVANYAAMSNNYHPPPSTASVADVAAAYIAATGGLAALPQHDVHMQ